MGLSASQARLLSITQRLSDNELHSEIIANSKMRLADEGIIAKNNYINALDSTKLQYVGFDGYGNADTVDLTFNSLMLYSEIKNQNILRNANGQVLISDTDAFNYEDSADMYDFVSRYCPDINYADYLAQITAHDDWQAHYNDYLVEYNNWWNEYQQYLAEHAEWEAAKLYFDTVTYPAWQMDHDNWQNVLMPAYNEELAFYNAYGAAGDVHQMFVDVVGTSSAPQSCYNAALNGRTGSIGDPGCYAHVLMFLLYPIELDDDTSTYNGGGSPENPATLTTSLKNSGNYVTITPTYNDWRGSALHTDFQNAGSNLLLPVYQAMLNENIYLCDGDDSNTFATTGVMPDPPYNMLKAAIAEGRNPTAAEILMSDYVYNYETGDVTQKKSLRQKAIDMLTIVKDFTGSQQYLTNDLSSNGPNWQMLRNLLINFTDGDMAKLTLTPPVEPDEPIEPTFDLEEPVLEHEEPVFNEQEPPLPSMNFQDKPLVQWYINLWHAIDGQDDPSELRARYDENGVFTDYTVENKLKQTRYDDRVGSPTFGQILNPAYQIIPDELRGDANWLQHALANGIISINQVITDSNANNLFWHGIEYSSTTSFQEVSDDKKVAQAEAEYQTEMKRIEMEDNKLDMKMKKLDTEHSALKTEYDSVAQLIGKNIERSYNSFNA